ncbi:MAG: hypothetical protein M3R04_09455 [bacterium]|nr:hypothetical protein [bacterium]
MRVVLAALMMAGVALPGAAASAPVTMQLPRGESASQIEWTAGGQLLVLVETSEGPALRLADPRTSELSVVPTPRSFLQLHEVLTIALAPSGNALAAQIPSSEANEPDQLRIYRLQEGVIDEVSVRKLHPEFFPNGLAWKHDGLELFIAAAAYVGPEQPHSVIGVDLATGAVRGVLNKTSADLIYEFGYTEGSDSIVLKCGAVGSEFPGEPVIALAGISAAEVLILHAEASELRVVSLADGTVFLTAPRSARERWMLPPGASKLQRSDIRLQLKNWTATEDGLWLGGLADGREVKKIAGKQFGVMQEKGGRTLVTSTPCSLLRFSHSGDSAAVVSADGTQISIVDLNFQGE